MKNQIKNTILLISTLIGLSFLLSSCNASKYLEEGQNFAGINRIILKSPERIEKKSTLKNELARLYKQKRNTNQMFVSIYYRTDDPSDTMWYDNFQRRFLAEEPSIFNETLVDATAREMEDFLRNKRGFYHAKVDYKLFNDGDGTIGVDYNINCGIRYRINSVQYLCQDSVLQAIIDSTKEESYLIPGDPVSSREYELERNRISNLLQNQGYAQFYTDYIELTGDSSNFKIDLTLNIYNPSDSSNHKKYYTGDVEVYTDFYPNQEVLSTKSDTIDGIVLYRELPEYFVRPELISSMINMRPGDITKNQNRQETYNRLSLLSPYKFIAIKQEVDSVQQSLINYDIQLIPKPGIWYWNPGLELNYTTLSQKDQLAGLGFNFSLENENLFKGAERFEVNFNADTDFSFLRFKPQEFYLQNTYNLTFPQTNSFHKASLFYPVFSWFAPQQYNRFTKYGSTSLNLGANYQSLDNTITILAGSASVGYEYRASEQEIIHINQIGVDYYSPTILNDTLFAGQFIRNSLSPRVITGLLFKDIAYAYTSKTVFRNFTWQLLSSLEFSGQEIFLANKIYNSLAKKDTYWSLESESIKFAKYVKSYLELRGQYKINQNNKLASRFFFGFGFPYGDNDVLPYTKQFFVGGEQSIRAWEKRGLGPGAYYNPNENEDNEIAYQKGDIKLEANIEYRFELPWYTEGAFFIDAGNIWTYNDDEEIENENFTREFYKQLAIGGGFGLRFDFNFLLLRFDIGYKLRTPYLDPTTQSHWVIRNTDILRDGNLTIGLDYPF